MQPLERILDHVLSGSQIPDHDQGQAHKLDVVVTEQVRHGYHGIAAVRPREPRPVTPPGRLVGYSRQHDIHARETLNPPLALQPQAVSFTGPSRRQ